MAETIDVDELIAILRPKVDTAAKAYPEADAINIWRSERHAECQLPTGKSQFLPEDKPCAVGAYYS